MSMSFDAYIVSIPKMKELLAGYGVPDTSLLDKALPKFGEVENDTMLLMNVEYWDEYNSYFELMRFIEGIYGIKTGYEVVSGAELRKVTHGANADEVAEELGVELPDEDEE
jgi:hypothetical protein